VRQTRPPTTARPLWGLAVVSALLIFLLGWARPTLPAAWRGAPATPAAFAQSEIKAAPARAKGPSFEAATKGARGELREPGERGGPGFCLPAPGAPLLAGPGAGSALAESYLAIPAWRRPLQRPPARGPPPPSPSAC
jgi:hypothetical protein